MAIPRSMRAVQLRAYDGKPESIAVVEMPVPRPGPGEVLVRVFASPINPSDLMFIRGLYGFKKPLPAVPGFEGSGTVVEAGAGMMPRFLIGRRVACAAADPKVTGGMWAKRLEGFWLTAWLRSRTFLGQLRLARQMQKLLRSDLKTDFQAKVPLQKADRALQQYAANMTAGKVLLMP
jgi:hypothetical protein